MKTISAIATLATKEAIVDLKLFLGSLAIWNSVLPKIYLQCDSAIQEALPSFKYPGPIEVRTALDKQGTIDRKLMEKTAGTLMPTLWADFMLEKTYLMDWALESESDVLFCDCDLFFLGGLPNFQSSFTTLALSPHSIRPMDESRQGRQNGGFVWTSEKTVPSLWRDFTKTSRYFEQAALEDLASKFSRTLYEYPIQVNQGWWRLWQGIHPAETLLKEWSLFRNEKDVGIRIQGQPLLSVHTHFTEKDDFATANFNKILVGYLEKLRSQPKVKALIHLLKPHIRVLG